MVRRATASGEHRFRFITRSFEQRLDVSVEFYRRPTRVTQDGTYAAQRIVHRHVLKVIPRALTTRIFFFVPFTPFGSTAICACV